MKKTLGYRFDLKANGDDGKFSGYGSVFGNTDAYDDVISQGAFAKSIAEKKPALLWQHRSDQPIGVWDVVREDPKGLYVEGRLLTGKIAQATEAHELLKAGALNGLSIGYIPVSWEFRKESDTRLRILKEIDLWEISLVTFPANEMARVQGVKSVEGLNNFDDAEMYLKNAGLSCFEAGPFLSRVKSLVAEEKAMEAADKLLKIIKGE